MEPARIDPADWSAAEGFDRLFRGEEPFVLDVRNREDHDSFPLEGRRPLPSHHVPYFEILEEGGAEGMVESVVAYARSRLEEVLPRDRTVLAVCARGDTSAFVARGLRELGYDAVNLAGGMEAWGNHHEVRTVVDGEGLAVYQVSRPGRGCLSYVVESRGRAVVVDPLRHVERYLELADEAGFQIEAAVDTHAHADHLSGGPELARRLDAPYFLHPYDGIHPLDRMPARLEFRYLREGQVLTVGDATLEALHVPGHTLGSVAFLLDGSGGSSGCLLAGDTIFLRSVARPDLGGEAERWSTLLHASLRRLLALPGPTVVLPGHFSSLGEADGEGLFAGRLDELARTNEALGKVEEGEDPFRRHVLEGLGDYPRRYAEIKRVNAGLAEADEDRADELELGKNRCATTPGPDERNPESR